MFCNKVAKHRCFPVNFVKFLMTFFLQATSIGCFWKFERCLCSRIFVLSLCLHLIYFHSYSFAPSKAKVSSNMVFSNVSLNDTGYRKKCIVRKHSWNSEKSRFSDNLANFLCRSLVFWWNRQTERLQLHWGGAQEIFAKLFEIPKNIFFRENHWATASGNDPGEPLVFWGKFLKCIFFNQTQVIF